MGPQAAIQLARMVATCARRAAIGSELRVSEQDAGPRPKLLQQRRRRDAGRAADPVDEERHFVDVTPVPVLAGLERTDDRVRRGVGVRLRMPVG